MSGNPSQSSGMGNGIGNMSQLAAAVQALSGSGGAPGMASGSMGMPSSVGNAGGTMTPSSGNQWAPAFNQYPLTNGSNATAIYPQLTGGYWNRLTQQLAGPQYQPSSGPNAITPGSPAAGGTAGQSTNLPNYAPGSAGVIGRGGGLLGGPTRISLGSLK
jgi:hypothetical protein